MTRRARMRAALRMKDLQAEIKRLLVDHGAHEITDALIEVGGVEVIPEIEASVRGYQTADDESE